jgi:hypothetical protein
MESIRQFPVMTAPKLEAKRPSKIPPIASVVLIVILGAGFAFTFVRGKSASPRLLKYRAGSTRPPSQTRLDTFASPGLHPYVLRPLLVRRMDELQIFRLSGTDCLSLGCHYFKQTALGGIVNGTEDWAIHPEVA